jgi:PIN domain nuclease of toxin-antitoxin system
VRALLDSHAFLWAVADDARLSDQAREVIRDRRNDILFSPATAYEIALKAAIGRLSLPDPVDVYISSRLGLFGFMPLPVEVHHGVRAGTLPPIHRDPWDRLLVAQAQIEGLPILTTDPAIGQYDVETIW